ncbi:MAG: TIGR00296 family protein [Candidatus Hydrothermarchaeales archaeon]
MYTIDEGKFLVGLARGAITEYLKTGEVLNLPKDIPEKLNAKAGVFVTLNTYPEGDLRGCIGYPEPIMPLYDATIKAAISSATSDPRFRPVTSKEFENIKVEVSVLTPPKLINIEKPQDYPSKIEIGRDGLIVEKGMFRGLLLPQVPVEQGWDKEEFLSGTCIKAGLMPDCWCDDETKIYKFSGKIFSEVKPRGDVEEKGLRGCE